jgi:hypothetical protein
MFNALLPILIKILITSTKSVNNTTKKIAELIPPMTYFSEVKKKHHRAIIYILYSDKINVLVQNVINFGNYVFIIIRHICARSVCTRLFECPIPATVLSTFM